MRLASSDRIDSMLYSSFYDIKREPFSLSPDPSFLYLTPTHREALAQMRYCIEARRGFAVLTGEVGTGKTTLLRALLDSIGSTVVTAYVLNPPQTRGELYAFLASELGLSLNGSETWLLRIHRFLLKQRRAAKTVVALFDEAQNIPIEVLEEIRLLTNLETADSKLLQVILAGQPELDRLIDSDGLRALRQRIALRHSLLPVKREEIAQYISSRLSNAGAGRMPFDREACYAVHTYSKGIPRLINSICEGSLIAGFVADQATIDARMVAEVARDARIIPASEARQTSRRKIAVTGAATALIAMSIVYATVPSASAVVRSYFFLFWHAGSNLLGALEKFVS
jgi:general secretion pathway protein A